MELGLITTVNHTLEHRRRRCTSKMKMFKTSMVTVEFTLETFPRRIVFHMVTEKWPMTMNVNTMASGEKDDGRYTTTSGEEGKTKKLFLFVYSVSD